MKNGRPVNLYLSEETLKKLEKIIAFWRDRENSSKSAAITELVNNEFDRLDIACDDFKEDK